MLRVTLEIRPYGLKAPKHIGHVSFENINGNADDYTGDYNVVFEHEGRYTYVEIKGFPRRDRDAWELLHQALGQYLKQREGSCASESQ